MTSTDSTSNQFSFKQKCQDFSNKSESKPTLKAPSFFYPQSIDNNILSSNLSEKKNNLGERINSYCSQKSGTDYDMFYQPFFQGSYKKINMPFFGWPLIDQPKFQSRMAYMGEEGNNNFKYGTNNIFFNYMGNEKEDFLKEKKDENKNNDKNNQNGNCNYLFHFLKGNYKINENNWTQEKSINLNLNMNMNMNTTTNNNNINNVGTKFFTNHNYGYKCSCSKTQCNRKYCECFNSGNYCIDCNCKNCNNKPPANSYTNKHPTDESKIKKNKIICTCTKSGCNKNYCECFKSGQKCSSLCRCIGCENNDEISNSNKKININKNNDNYECCLANSIFIVKNNIFIEDIKNIKQNDEKLRTNINVDTTQTHEDYSTFCKKRKREETKINEECNVKNKKIRKNSDEVNLFNDSLFDNNGKVILRHINLIHI